MNFSQELIKNFCEVESTKESFKYQINEDLLEHIPWFIKRREDELPKLRECLLRQDYDEIKKIGHGLKGIGTSFGFSDISLYGRRFELIAKYKGRRTLILLLNEYSHFLNSLKRDLSL